MLGVQAEREYLKSVKLGCHSLDEAIALADTTVAKMKAIKNQYMEDYSIPVIDRTVDETMNKTLVDLFKYNFLTEVLSESKEVSA